VGNRISQTDANVHTTLFAYDDMHRRIGRTLPAGQSEAMTYDLAANETARTDFNGHTTIYAHDAMRRLLSKTPDPFFNATPVEFSYMLTGRRATMSDTTGLTTYSYDARDRVLQKATPEGTLMYTLDHVGNRLSMHSELSDGVNVSYAWDEDERLSTVVDHSTGGGTTTYDYDYAGNLESFGYPNGVTTTNTFDNLNRLTDISVANSSGVIAAYDYSLGATGNRTAVMEASGRTVAWRYDSLYRLTSEVISWASSGNGTIGYTYDPVGNRLGRTSSVSGVPATTSGYGTNDTLNSDGYDANGDTRMSGSNAYQYDFEDRLVSMNNGSVVVSYDGDGNRLSKTASGTTTTYLIDDAGGATGYSQAVEERVGGSVQRVYVYGRQIILQRQLLSSAWVTSYYTQDASMNVRALTGTSGALTDTWDYEAFGTVVGGTGTTPNRILFAGEYNDPDSGFVYDRARSYVPYLGRFPTRDTFQGLSETPTTLDAYLYASENPIDGLDPSGHWDTSTRIFVAVSLVALVAFGVFQADRKFHPNSCNTPGGCPGLDAYAMGVLNDIKSNASKYDTKSQEYTGWIYSDGKGSFSKTEVTSGSTDHASPGVLSAWNAVANYHTHPPGTMYSDNEDFSGTPGNPVEFPLPWNSDAGFCSIYAVYCYLLTPKGAIKKYDPFTSADRADTYLQYATPTAPK
jgi:RHS repeat-associated protein